MVAGNVSSILEPVGNADVLKFGAVESARSILDQIVRDGARKMLQVALENEANAFLESHASKVHCEGRRMVVRNGHLPTREIITGAGSLEVQQPRVRDKSPGAQQRVKFSSSILPPYLRRSKVAGTTTGVVAK